MSPQIAPSRRNPFDSKESARPRWQLKTSNGRAWTPREQPPGDADSATDRCGECRSRSKRSLGAASRNSRASETDSAGSDNSEKSAIHSMSGSIRSPISRKPKPSIPTMSPSARLQASRKDSSPSRPSSSERPTLCMRIPASRAISLATCPTEPSSTGRGGPKPERRRRSGCCVRHIRHDGGSRRSRDRSRSATRLTLASRRVTCRRMAARQGHGSRTNGASPANASPSHRRGCAVGLAVPRLRG